LRVGAFINDTGLRPDITALIQSESQSDSFSLRTENKAFKVGSFTIFFVQISPGSQASCFFSSLVEVFFWGL
jgi:hypothetical protein